MPENIPRHTPINVNVIGTFAEKSSNFGWAVDGQIVVKVLAASGFDVRSVNAHFYWGEGLIQDARARLAREKLGLRHRLLPSRDVNIFLERVVPQMFPAARRQILIPNQEWFLERWLKYLTRFDAVLCKTRAAQQIFDGLGCRTFFSSFTSGDKRVISKGPKRREFLMLLGRRQGIAERVIALWSRHPEWPQLTLCGVRLPAASAPGNVRLIRDYLSDNEVTRLQNERLFHLAVTAAEGFGHKINEAFSCGAIVLATDAPPMNEMVTAERGLLVKWNASTPRALGHDFQFDEADLERVIQRALKLGPNELDEISREARGWFESNDGFFNAELTRCVTEVAGLPRQCHGRS